jgi:heme-degrading monooxygenase HmoA
MEIAETPQPPYFAVIFTSLRNDGDKEYAENAKKMVELAQHQSGFLGYESARENLGITVSYWESLDAIKAWKKHTEHLFVQKQGKEIWYKAYKVRICKVERDYGFDI